MNEKELFNTIYYEVLSIENELKAITGEGVFFAPELYIGFRISKAIYLNRKNIFGDENVKWHREIKEGDSGPSDIVFQIPEEKDIKKNKTIMVIELKLRSTYDAYKRDIMKLQRIKEVPYKYFCVLLDSFIEDNDERVKNLYNIEGVNLVQIDHRFFKTKQDWYASQVYCNLNLIKVN